jgi:hypothetical protein
MTRRQLLASMDSVELVGWKAFFKIENEEMDRRMKPKPQPLDDRIKAGLMAMGGKRAGQMVRKPGPGRN